MSPEKAATRAHRGLGRHRQRGELNVQLAYRERFRGYADHSIHCRAGDDWRGRSCLAVAGYCASERRATNMRGGKAARRGALCGPTGKLFPVRPVKQKSRTAEAALRKSSGARRHSRLHRQRPRDSCSADSCDELAADEKAVGSGAAVFHRCSVKFLLGLSPYQHSGPACSTRARNHQLVATDFDRSCLLSAFQVWEHCMFNFRVSVCFVSSTVYRPQCVLHPCV